MEREEMKKKLSHIWDKVKEVSKDAVVKGKEYTILAELKVKLGSLKRERNDEFEALGKLTYQLLKEKEKNFQEKEPFLAQIKKIELLDEKINELELEMKRVREEYSLEEEFSDNHEENEDENSETVITEKKEDTEETKKEEKGEKEQ